MSGAVPVIVPNAVLTGLRARGGQQDRAAIASVRLGSGLFAGQNGRERTLGRSVKVTRPSVHVAI